MTARLFPHALLATGLNVRVRTLEVFWTVWLLGAALMLVRLLVRIRSSGGVTSAPPP
jgi:hypothetical protein